MTPAILHPGATSLVVHAVTFFWFGSVLERLVGSYVAVAMWAVWQLLAGVLQWFLSSGAVMTDAMGPAAACGATALVCGTIAFLTLRPRFDASVPLRVPAGTPIAMVFVLSLATLGVVQDVAVIAGWTGLIAGLATAALPIPAISE